MPDNQNINDLPSESITNVAIDAVMEAVEYQSEFIPPASNLKYAQKQQIPKDVIAKRIYKDIRDVQVVAGLTPVQRKILLAQLEITKLKMDDKTFTRTTDSEVARKAGIHRNTVALFNENPTCQDALVACTNIIVRNAYGDIIAGIWKHGETSYQPLLKLLEIVNLYREKRTIETTNRNLNVNLEIGNSPDAIMRQLVIKLGAANYDRQRFQDEIMAVWDNCKAEGAF